MLLVDEMNQRASDSSLNFVFKKCPDELRLPLDASAQDIEKNLNAAINALKEGEIDALYVKSPFKSPALSHLDLPSEASTAINAVNLIYLESGKLVGRNADYHGALGAMHTLSPSLKGKNVHVLGAGAAARAAAYVASREGAKVSIWNRTGEKAQNYAEKLGLEWVEDIRKWQGKPQIIVNATSASESSRQSTLVPFPQWEQVDLAIDAVYGAEMSLFLEEAKAMQVQHLVKGEKWLDTLATWLEACLLRL